MSLFPAKLSHNGQSLAELVVALGIFAAMAVSMISLILGGLSMQVRSREFTEAAALANEGLEAVRSIRDRDWNELTYNRSAVTVSGNRWIFSGEGTTETIGDFFRVIDLTPVYRDGAGNIVDIGTPGSYHDASSTKVSVSVSWEIRPEVTDSVERVSYLIDR